MATTATGSMKIVCDRTALVDALTMASSVVMARTTIPVLLCVKLSARDGTLHLQATDQDIRLSLSLASVEVQSDGEALIPADKLAQIVRSCDDTTLTIEMDKTMASVRGEDAKFRVYGYDPREFPVEREKSQIPTEFEVSAGVLRRMISRTVFATAADNTRYAFNGVLLERKARKLRMVATDGRRLAMVRGDCSGTAEGDASCIIPTKALNVLNRLLDDPETSVRIARDRNRIHFMIGESAVLVSSLIEGNFPPFDDVLPKEHDRRGTFDTAELAAAVKRAALLTNEESKGVKLSFNSAGVTISARAAEMGDAEIHLPALSWEGAEIEIGFNPSYVTDVLRIADTTEIAIELKAGNRPGVVKIGNDFTYVIMPVSLPS
ncbi:MAG: DNA polymerase III subunit beta [Phycisphaerales bacterium]|nr:DNA polymerase III subunit beta [Phycisphaerales bacterium]